MGFGFVVGNPRPLHCGHLNPFFINHCMLHALRVTIYAVWPARAAFSRALLKRDVLRATCGSALTLLLNRDTFAFHRFTHIPSQQSHPPFINHFAACQMCSIDVQQPKFGQNGKKSEEWDAECHEQFWLHIQFANITMEMLLG
jgi:hypothetical protein